MQRSIILATSLVTALAASCRSSSGEPRAVVQPRVVPQVSAIEPRRVCFSPTDTGRLLVVEANGRVGIWNLLEGGSRLFASVRARAVDAAFSPDGRFVATASLDGRVRWWSVDGKLLWVSETGHQRPARTVGVSTRLVVSGGEDGTLRLWKLDGTPLGSPLKAHETSVVSVDISPSGDLVSLGGDETLLLWKRNGKDDASDVPTYETKVLFRPERRHFGNFESLLRLEPTWGWDHSVAFAPAGDLIASVLFDGSLRLWNADGSARAAIEKVHSDRPVRSLAVSPAGDLIASVGFDGRLRFWDSHGSPRGRPIDAHEGPAFSVSFSRDGKLVATTGRDDRIRVWNSDGTAVSTLPRGSPGGISTVALATGDGVLAVADEVGGVRIWGFDGARRATLQEPPGTAVQALVFAPHDETIAGGGADGMVRRWRLDGKPSGDPMDVGGPVSTLSFAPSGDMLAVGAQPFQVWRRDKQLWQHILRSADQVTSIAFPPSGDSIITGSVLGDLQIWSRTGKSLAYRPKRGIEMVGSVVLTPRGDSLIAAFGATQTIVQEFDLSLSPRGTPFEGHFGRIRQMAIAPDGRLAAGGEDGTVRLWALPSREVQEIDVGLPIDQLGFWKDLLWVRADGRWLFFYETTGTLRATLFLDRDAILAFTPDGWYSEPAARDPSFSLYDGAGNLIASDRVRSQRSPERVLSAIAGPARK